MTQPNSDAGPDPGATPASSPALPRPIIKKMHWPYPLIWLVPIAAAVLAGFYFIQQHREHGPLITITFPDADQIKPGQTPVNYRGITLGKVESIELTPDHSAARVHVRLEEKAKWIARQGTVFWPVRPELSLEDISGLGTLVSGPYIEALPGNGPETTDFQGATKAPILRGPGIRLILHAKRLEHTDVDSPVMFRGIQVGVVQDIRLSDVADTANVTVFIWQRYTPLVHSGSEFWVIKGADIKGGLFGGVKLQLGSLQSLLEGGVAFATPDLDEMGPAAKDGDQFTLNDDSKSAWLDWAPKIPLPPEDSGENAQQHVSRQAKTQLPALAR